MTYDPFAGERRVVLGLETRILDIATLGPALFQEQVNRTIQMCHKRAKGAQAALNFVPGAGDAWHLNRQTPGPDAMWVDDTDSLDCVYPDADAAEATYEKTSFPFKCMLLKGNVSRKAIARGRSYVDVLALELGDATERATYTLEKCIFQGNYGGATPKQFDGLFQLLAPYNDPADPNDRYQVYAALDGADSVATAGTLTLSLLDKVIDEVKGGDKVIFCSRAGRRVIRSLQQAFINHNDRTRIAAGLEVETYMDAPLVTTDGIPDTMTVVEAAGLYSIGALTGGDTTAIVVVNSDDVFIAELTPLTVEPLAKCTTQRQKFEAYWDGTLVLNCPESAAMIINVATDC